jgi:hypothetical protein
MDTDDEFAVSYLGVSLGVPVLTRDGEQFGILEHVMQVPEEDLFEGIVVWVGGGTWTDRQIQRDLSRNHVSAARVLESLRPHHLRFVPADQIAAITVGYIRCGLDDAQVSKLQPPSGSSAIHLSDFNKQTYGSIFGMTRGTRRYRLPPPGSPVP